MKNFFPEYKPIAPQSETAAEKPDQPIKPLYRGIWAERLKNGQDLPIGGSLFSGELKTKLELDFNSFDEQLSNFTADNLRLVYDQGRESFESWLKGIGSDVDPYTYFLCYQTQQKMSKLLEVSPDAPDNSAERNKVYAGEKTPKLSDLKGKSACAERAALGQYILRRAGLESTYVSGITMQNAKDEDEYPEDHSFIVLKHPTKEESSLIFDIARPLRSQGDLPRVLETSAPFTHELLKDKEELLVEAKETLQGNSLYFGVGEPAAGWHKTIERIENKN